jgi:hypothetical protein
MIVAGQDVPDTMTYERRSKTYPVQFGSTFVIENQRFPERKQ